MAEKTKLLLGDFINADRIMLLPGKNEKDDVLNKLIDCLAAIPEIGSRDELARGVFHRESLMSTAIGNGIALPHFKLISAEKSYVALAVCPEGVSNYDAMDTESVKLVFMIVAGKKHKLLHVKLMNIIGKLFYDGALKDVFLAAGNAEECMKLLLQAEA